LAEQRRRSAAGLAHTLAPALGIFLLSLALRLVYLYQIRELPFFAHHIGDARSYVEWAQRITAGNWLGDRVFYQAPAYPYFLALVQTFAGEGAWRLHVAQALVGSLSCVAIYAAARLLFSPATGVVAGLMLALYPPAIFFDGLVQKAGLGLMLTSGLLALVALFQRQRTAASIAACGALLGMLALTRENALVFALAIPIWIALRFREASLRRRAAWVAIFLVGLAAVLLPVGLRNHMVGDTFAITTSQLGSNFYIGNNPQATGVYAPLLPGRHSPRFEGPDAARLAEQALGRPLSKGEVSSYWLGRGLAFAREQPLDWLALLARKLLLTWNAFEVPDTEDIYVAADWSWLLRGLLAFFHFGVLVPLAVAGMFFAWSRRPDSLLLYWLTAVFTGATALFYVFARYRFPLVPLLLPFAALAWVEIAQRLHRREFGELAWPLVLFSFSAVVANLSLVESEPLHAVAYMNLGGIELQEGRLAEAERYLEQGEALNPDYADLQLHLGLLRLAQGRLPEAETHLRRTLALEPGDPRARRGLADLRARRDPTGPVPEPPRDSTGDPR